MRILGFSLREVERRMGLSSSYLSRLLSGRVELKVDHVVEIARAINLDPGEIFLIAFSGRPESLSEAAIRTREALGHLVAQPPPATGPLGEPAADSAAQSTSSEQMEQLIARTLRRFFSELAGDKAGTG